MKSPKTSSKETSEPTDRISPSSMSLLKCFFYQEETSENPHQITQDSKDSELKMAFRDSPISLGTYKIRYERAADATAGDLKYHSSCWRDIIFKRVKDWPGKAV